MKQGKIVFSQLTTFLRVAWNGPQICMPKIPFAWDREQRYSFLLEVELIRDNRIFKSNKPLPPPKSPYFRTQMRPVLWKIRKRGTLIRRAMRIIRDLLWPPGNIGGNGIWTICQLQQSSSGDWLFPWNSNGRRQFCLTEWFVLSVLLQDSCWEYVVFIC